MNTILALTKTTIKMFIRSRQALFFSLFLPLMLMFTFGVIGFDKALTFDVGLVSENPQPATKNFVNQIKNFSIFNIHSGSLDDELKELKDGNRSAVIVVPDDFINSSIPSEPKKMILYENEGKKADSQTIQSILSQTLDKLTLEMVQAPTFFTIEKETVDARNLKFIDFILPGLMAMSVMQMSVFSVAFLFVQYKEKGMLKRLLATPMRPEQFVAANIITRLLVSIAQVSILIAVGILFLKAHVIGSYAIVFLCVVLGSLMFLGLGFTISGISKTVDSVPALANMITLPMLLLGGVFFSIPSMPQWLQHVAKFLPLTFLSSALRNVMTKGAGIVDIKWDILGMLVWVAILITLAVITFSFQEKEGA